MKFKLMKCVGNFQSEKYGLAKKRNKNLIFIGKLTASVSEFVARTGI